MAKLKKLIRGRRRFPLTDHVLFATPHIVNRKKVNLFQLILHRKENGCEQRNGESPLCKDGKFKIYRHP